MSQRQWISRSTLLVAGVFAAATLTACGSQNTGSALPTTGTSTSKPSGSAGSTSTTAASLTVSDAAATKLCDLIKPQLSDWRVQGPELGKIGLNLLVHEWALENGGINGQVLQDKAIIDRLTTKSCPDTRQQAIEALNLADLASGLAF